MSLKALDKNIPNFSIKSLSPRPLPVGHALEYLKVKDYLPHLFHGFRNKNVNKISFDSILYFYN